MLRFCEDHSLERLGRIPIVVAAADEFGFTLIDQRKNRWSHPSHRNGLTKSMGRILRSMIPLRLDRRMCSLWHHGQFIITILLMRELNCRAIFCQGKAWGLSYFEHSAPMASITWS